MAIIRSSESSDELVIDPISKGARVVLYNPDGSPVSEDNPLKIGLAVPVEIAPGDVNIGSVDQGDPNTPDNSWPTTPYGIEGNPISVGITGGLKVDGSAFTQPISGTVSVSNLPGTQPVSAASLPLPSGAATETTLAAINTKTPTLVSGRQPVDGSGVVQPVSGTVAVSNFPGTSTNFYVALTAGFTTGFVAETLMSLLPNKQGVVGSASTSYVVPVGKVLRIHTITVSLLSSAAAITGASYFLRHDPSGVLSVTSPLICASRLSTTVGNTSAGDRYVANFGQTIDIAAGNAVGMSVINRVAGDLNAAMILGIEQSA